jgi:hypothetical protein
MEVRLATGDGIKDGTRETKGDTSTDEIYYFYRNISFAYLLYDCYFLYAD